MTLAVTEQREALDPGLFPDPVLLGLEWDQLAELREEHIDALAAVQTARAQLDAASAPYRDAGGQPPVHPEPSSKLFKARAAHHAAVAEAERIAGDVVAEARALLPEWRAALDAPAAARRAEAEQLRARLDELEAERWTERLLRVWLDRLDPEKKTPGLHPWAALADLPAPPEHRAGPLGPIAQSFANQQEEALT
jgi:hypothetical protein